MPSSPPSPSRPADDATWTVARLLSWTQERFAQIEIESPRVDAEHLLAFALGCSRMSLYVEHDKVVNATERGRFRELVKRRLAREPVAYIEGKRGFHALDLELSVDRRVLIPRPETEHLVDWMLEDLPPPGGLVRKGMVEDEADEPLGPADFQPVDDGSESSEPEPEAVTPVEPEAVPEPEPEPPPTDTRVVLDVGTGSGAIALALKRSRSTLTVMACDVSEDAVTVARANAERLGLDVEIVVSDLLTRVTAPSGGFAAIAANLPYIREPIWRGLAPEVRVFEPRLALDGGEDGLGVIRRLVATAPRYLAPGGGLFLEIGYDQGESVPALLAEHGYVDVAVRRDHAGHPRIVRGRRPA
ncbi:MAG: HemK/PrmC family methyltransferase [Nannocystaceae bacterium]